MISSTSNERASSPDVYFVGLRWPQHAKVSGYDAIVHHLGTPIRLPIVDRWPWKDASDQRLLPRSRYWFTEQVSGLLDRLVKPTYSLPLLRMELAVARHMARRRGAVYHVLYGETDVCLLGWFGRLTRNHVVASFHDGREVLEGCGVTGPILRSLSAVVLLGRCQTDYFTPHVARSRIHVIPHGVDTDFFLPPAATDTAPPGPSDDRLVLTVGGHTRDHATLGQAVASIVDQNPGVRFVAVSANLGNKGSKLAGERIEHVTGISDEQLRTLYQQAAVSVFAFQYAVANNAVLESLACGTPVVATDIGAVGDYLSPDAGRLVPPGDAAALAAAVLEILEEPSPDRISAAARTNAERFDLPVVCDQLRRLYRHLAGATNAPPAGDGAQSLGAGDPAAATKP